VANARSASYAGTLSGTRSQVSAVLGNGVDFDGSTGFMSSAGTTGLNFGTGITVEAFIRRDTNTSEDGIVSKWYGADQFLLGGGVGEGTLCSPGIVVLGSCEILHAFCSLPVSAPQPMPRLPPWPSV